jgi:8-oxo-dGTP diphosphatase
MRIIEGVSGALIKDGKILIVRRSKDDDFLPGYYELPGGSIEPNETREQAVTRELQEELSLKVKTLKPYHEFSYQPGPNTKCTDYEYLVALADDENIKNLHLSPEHDDYKWIDIEELNKIKLITPEMLNSITLALE